MTLETLKDGMRMFDCSLLIDEKRISIVFEQMVVKIDRDFDLGTAEARTFMLYNSLKHLRETLDEEQLENPFDKDSNDA